MERTQRRWIAVAVAGLVLACLGCEGDDTDGATGDGSEPPADGTGDPADAATPAESSTPTETQEPSQAFSEALQKALESVPEESRELTVPGGINAALRRRHQRRPG